jgi:signal transduction histidine kinase
MEVALASPRSRAQYVRGLCEALEFVERMRTIVRALREVADVKDEESEKLEIIELQLLLRETIDNLDPVAGAKSVHIVLHFSAASSLKVWAGRRTLASAAFRMLESALSLAAPGSAMRVEADAAPTEICIHVQWFAGQPVRAVLQTELGLLVAQAAWERTGGQWERTLVNSLETLTIRLPNFAGRVNL